MWLRVNNKKLHNQHGFILVLHLPEPIRGMVLSKDRSHGVTLFMVRNSPICLLSATAAGTGVSPSPPMAIQRRSGCWLIHRLLIVR